MNKKLLALTTSTIAYLSTAPYALAQVVGIEKPANANITDLNRVIRSGIDLVIIFSGVLVFVYLVWGGVDWLTSGGDKTKTEGAQKKITAALTGLAIIAAAWAITKLISYFFGVDAGVGQGVAIPRPF